MKNVIKTKTQVATNPFYPEIKKFIYGEVSISKVANRREYTVEVQNYTLETIGEGENQREHKKLLRGKEKAPFPIRVKKVSYEDFDDMISQFEQAVTIPETITTTGDKFDFLATIVMLKINNGEIPDLGETEPYKLCEVDWELVTE